MPPQGFEGLRGARGILANVEPHRAEAEDFHLSAHRPDHRARDLRTAAIGQSALERAQVVDQAIGVVIAAAFYTTAPGYRGVEPADGAGQKLAKGLAGIAHGNLLALAAGVQRIAQRGRERRLDRQGGLGDRQRADKFHQLLPMPLQRGRAAGLQGAAGDLVGDEWIAVPIAADPRAEFDEGRYIDGVLAELSLERLLRLGDQFRCDLEQRLVEKVQAPGYFLLHIGLLQAQFAGQPQQFDLVAQRIHQRRAFARRPPRRLEIHQQPVDAPMPLQHGDALGLGGMGGEHRAHTQLAQLRADGLGRHTALRSRGDHLCEGARHMLRPAIGIDLAALAHRTVLLGNAQQLEHHALRLQRAGKTIGRQGAIAALHGHLDIRRRDCGSPRAATRTAVRSRHG